MTNLAVVVRALTGAGALALSLGAVLLTAGPAASQTQGVIVWESGTDYPKSKRKKLRAGGQGTGAKADAIHKETIEVESYSWGSTGTRKRQGAKRRAN